MAYIAAKHGVILYTPIALGVGYFTVSALLFFYGPIAWPPIDQGALALFLTFAFVAIALGWSVGVRLKSKEIASSDWLWIALIAGAAANVLLLFPAAYVYTGSMPWDFFEALADQRSAYEKMQRVLAEGMPFRSIVAGLRVLFGPVTVVLPILSILLWGRMDVRLRVLTVAGLLASSSFSVFRGTDKETFDVLILQGSALAVVVARYMANAALVPYRRLGAALVIVALVLGMLMNSFIDRKAQRLGFDAQETVEKAARHQPVSSFCIGGVTCTDAVEAEDTAAYVQLNFALSIVTAYVAQGYYGLGLAMAEPTQTMFGFGHSNILTRVYSSVFDDPDFQGRAVTTRLADEGWDPRYQWSTAYTWLANDFGVWGAGFVVGFIALVWGFAWKDAIYGRNDAAGVVFCLLASFFVYLPASNQIMQTADGYFALVVWVLAWLVSRTSYAPLLRWKLAQS